MALHHGVYTTQVCSSCSIWFLPIYSMHTWHSTMEYIPQGSYTSFVPFTFARVFIMDVPTLMYNLKEEVTCSVCIQLYTNPKQLPCLHIFCLECLNNLARTSTRYGKIKCPICQAEVAVPESGTMETLPSCFYVKNLLDTLAIKECNTSKVTCGNCDVKSENSKIKTGMPTEFLPSFKEILPKNVSLHNSLARYRAFF